MGWRKRKGPLDPPDGAQGPLNDKDPGDWIVVPYRTLEAARISVFTIGSHPDLPEHMRWWVASWLASYNSMLSRYFEETYGPNIFPLLEKITNEVRDSSQKAYDEAYATAVEDDFKAWREEFENGQHE